jgi:hypothetical protein
MLFRSAIHFLIMNKEKEKKKEETKRIFMNPLSFFKSIIPNQARIPHNPQKPPPKPGPQQTNQKPHQTPRHTQTRHRNRASLIRRTILRTITTTTAQCITAITQKLLARVADEGGV